MNNHDLLIEIQAKTGEIAASLAEMKREIALLRNEVDELKLARARLDGQIDMLWKLLYFIGFSGVIALIKAFAT
jgi:hypothetical protein